MRCFITQSEEQTLNWARTLANGLKGGDIIALEGDLGAGKTVFAQGAARSLGLKTISSPTFVVMMLYKIKNKNALSRNIKFFCHIDAYRITPAGLTDIGAKEYIGRPDTLTIIEWADKVKSILPKKVKWIRLKSNGPDQRKITQVD